MICKKCQIDKSVSEYYSHSRGCKTGVCKKCHIIAVLLYQKAHQKTYSKTEEARRKMRVFYKENRTRLIENSKKYYQDNKGKVRITRRKSRSSTKYKVAHNASCRIWKGLKGRKAHRSWEILVGYTYEQLKQHIESQFQEGMSWSNYGEWHIDHIIPVSVFNFDCPEHIDFKRCWALENLQPLWAKENLSKSAKVLKQFQPSLKLKIS